MSDLATRLADKILIDDGCWEWTAAKSDNGYGRIKMGGRYGTMALAHRVVYELLVGPIPEGLQIDHLCRNRACVNPAHLEPVTPAENSRRGSKAQATHCRYGHDFVRRGRQRVCLVCKNARARARKESN